MNHRNQNEASTDRQGRPAARATGGALFPGIYGILTAVSAAGLLDAVYLARVHLSATRTCGEGDGCSAALNSPWAEVAGIPVAALGAGMYLALLWFTVRILYRRKTAAADETWLCIISAAGTLAGLFFTLLQATVIPQWCPFCLLSAGLTALFFLLCLANGFKTGSLRMALKAPGILSGGLPWVLLTLLVPPLIVLAVAQGQAPADTGRDSSGEQVVGFIDARKYTLAEVDDGIQAKLQQLDEERYRLRKAFLDDRLLAQEASAQELTPQALLQQAVFSKIAVSEEDVRRYIVKNRANLPSQISSDLARQIGKHLSQKKTAAAMVEYMATLKEKHHAQFFPPLPQRLTIAANPRGGPETGPADAPVTLIVFTDFECPYCRRTHHGLHALMDRYPDKIRMVFRHFPLASHKLAGQAAEQAWCAHQQGRFWPFADSVFAHQGRLSEAALQDYAEQAGMADMAAFRRCVQSGRGKKAIDSDRADGRHFGVQGTPTLFINGRFFAGMPRDIDAVIQEELDKAANRP